MTENEAIERLINHRIFMQINDSNAKEHYNKFGELAHESILMAIKALEEIQQYRAIGTVEECREAMERQRGKKPIRTIRIDMCTCPFCGDGEDLQILNQGDVVGWDCHYNCDIEKKKSFAQLFHTWFVNCPTCGTCGPEFYTGGTFGLNTDDECKQAAIEAWNKRV